MRRNHASKHRITIEWQQRVGSKPGRVCLHAHHTMNVCSFSRPRAMCGTECCICAMVMRYDGWWTNSCFFFFHLSPSRPFLRSRFLGCICNSNINVLVIYYAWAGAGWVWCVRVKCNSRIKTTTHRLCRVPSLFVLNLISKIKLIHCERIANVFSVNGLHKPIRKWIRLASIIMNGKSCVQRQAFPAKNKFEENTEIAHRIRRPWYGFFPKSKNEINAKMERRKKKWRNSIPRKVISDARPTVDIWQWHSFDCVLFIHIIRQPGSDRDHKSSQ